ncbi:serine hydrolase [soil metagenome]
MSQEAVLAAIQADVDAFPGTAGVFAKNITTGEEVAFDPDTVRPTASTIKVPIMIELFRQVEAGEVSLDDLLTANEANATKGSGILRDLSSGISLRAEDICTLMIVVSDNQATNMLIDLLGMDKINATLAANGFEKTRLVNRIDFDTIGEDAKNLATTTPRELAGIMEGIATKTVLTPASCDGMLGILAKQHYLDTAPRYFPYTPFAAESGKPDNGLRVFNKTGSWSGMRADAVIVEWPGTQYVIGVISEGDTDPRYWAENSGNRLLGKLSKHVFDYFGGDKLAPIAPLTY